MAFQTDLLAPVEQSQKHSLWLCLYYFCLLKSICLSDPHTELFNNYRYTADLHCCIVYLQFQKHDCPIMNICHLPELTCSEVSLSVSSSCLLLVLPQISHVWSVEFIQELNFAFVELRACAPAWSHMHREYEQSVICIGTPEWTPKSFHFLSLCL